MLGGPGERLGRHGLTLHATKTRFADFRPRRPTGVRPKRPVAGPTYAGAREAGNRLRVYLSLRANSLSDFAGAIS